MKMRKVKLNGRIIFVFAFCKARQVERYRLARVLILKRDIEPDGKTDFSPRAEL
jgi:hypothetical protein